MAPPVYETSSCSALGFFLTYIHINEITQFLDCRYCKQSENNAQPSVVASCKLKEKTIEMTAGAKRAEMHHYV